MRAFGKCQWKGSPKIRMISFIKVQAQSPVELLSCSQSSACAGLVQLLVSAAKMGIELICVGVCFCSYSLDVQWMCCLHE